MNVILINLNNLRNDTIFKNYCVPVILGALTTIWTHVVLTVGIYGSLFHDFRDSVIIDGIRQTHYVISIATSVGLVYAFKKVIRSYLMPWLIWKIFECIGYLLSLIWFFGLNYRPYYDYAALGLGIMIVNLFLIRSMWKTFKMMPDLPPHPPKYEDTKTAIPPTELSVTI